MKEQQPKFGFTPFAETWNGRLAMLGFVIGLATEWLTGQSILQQLGLIWATPPFLKRGIQASDRDCRHSLSDISYA